MRTFGLHADLARLAVIVMARRATFVVAVFTVHTAFGLAGTVIRYDHLAFAFGVAIAAVSRTVVATIERS